MLKLTQPHLNKGLIRITKGITSPIHIKISKLEGSYIIAEASSQTLRKAHAQALKDRGSDIPVARNNLKTANQYKND